MPATLIIRQDGEVKTVKNCAGKAEAETELLHQLHKLCPSSAANALQHEGYSYEVLDGLYVINNGALVLEERRNGDKHVALCAWRDGFVTWRLDAERNAYWGHYHQGDLEAARKDFAER